MTDKQLERRIVALIAIYEPQPETRETRQAHVIRLARDVAKRVTQLHSGAAEAMGWAGADSATRKGPQ